MASTREIALMFAKEAFNSSKEKSGASALSFVGNYGKSYLATVARKTGPKTAQVTSKRYSVTTTKHTNQFRAALLSEGWTVTEADF